MQNCVTFALLISQDSRKKLTLSSEIKLNNLDLPMWTYMLIVYLSTSGYDPKGTQNVFISIYVKISCYIFVVVRWRSQLYIFFVAVSTGRAVVPSPKIVINLTMTFEKENHISSATSFSTDRQRDILILLYKDILWF